MKNNFKIKNIIVEIRNYHPTKPLSFLYFMVPIFIAITRSMKINNDYWFLVNTGKYILKNGIPYIEPFTIHNNFSFVAQQWLSTCILYIFHFIFGYFGAFIFTISLFIIILFLFYKLCMLVSNNRRNLSVLVSMIALIFLNPFITSRPQMFDYIILLILIYCLELYIRKNNKKVLIILPILSVLMINLHCSSWFMLYAFILPYVINSFKFKIFNIESEGYELKWLLIAILIMLICGFINPYGIKAITYIFTSYGNSYINETVYEMQPLNIHNINGIFCYLTIFIVLLLYLFGSKKNIKIRYFLLYLGTTYLSVCSVKGYSFFIIASIFPLADILSEKFLIAGNNYKHSNRFKFVYVFILLLFTILIFYYISISISTMGNNKLKKTMDYIDNNEDNYKSVKIFTSYNDGGYIEYRGYRAYIDPRAEVFLKKNNKKEDIFKEYYLLNTGKLNITKFLNKYDFNYIITSKNDYIYKYYLKKNTKLYKMVYKDNNYYLLKKSK